MRILEVFLFESEITTDTDTPKSIGRVRVYATREVAIPLIYSDAFNGWGKEGKRA